MSRDLWSGGRYYDLDEALSYAQDCFVEDLKAIWEDATGAERQQISHERHAAGVRNKTRRDWTATEFAVSSRLAHADWLAGRGQDPGPDEVPF